MANKEKIHFLIIIFFGYFGIHKFIEGKTKEGFIYLFTYGLFAIGWIYDIYKFYKNCKNKEYLAMLEEITKKQIDNKKDNVNIKWNFVDNDYRSKTETDYKTRVIRTKPKDYVVFDTETTGLIAGSDRIIEIGAIKYKNNVEVDRYNVLINPEFNLPKKIVDLTGITDGDLKDKKNMREVLPEFISFIEDLPLVAHNASFDISMLNGECTLCDVELIKNKVIDTLAISRKLFRDVENHKLSTLKKYLKMEIESHRAVNDCEICAKIYQMYLEK